MELHLSYRARDLQGRCANPALGPLLREEGLWSDGHCRHLPSPELPEKPPDLGSQTATTFPRGPSSRNQPPYTRLPKPGKPPPRARASRLGSRSAHRARPRVCSHPMRCYPRTRIGRWVAGWPWLPKPARPPSPGKLPPATGPAPAPTSRSSRARCPHFSLLPAWRHRRAPRRSGGHAQPRRCLRRRHSSVYPKRGRDIRWVAGGWARPRPNAMCCFPLPEITRILHWGKAGTEALRRGDGFPAPLWAGEAIKAPYLPLHESSAVRLPLSARGSRHPAPWVEGSPAAYLWVLLLCGARSARRVFPELAGGCPRGKAGMVLVRRTGSRPAS